MELQIHQATPELILYFHQLHPLVVVVVGLLE
jgi:hypothetical protein